MNDRKTDPPEDRTGTEPAPEGVPPLHTADRRRRWLASLGKILRVIGVVVAAAYPILVWFGLSHLRIRTLALVLLVLLIPSYLSRLRFDLKSFLRILPMPLALGALLVVAALVEDRRFMMVMPVLINLVLFVGFVSSLRGMPMIERFARMQVGDDLSDEEVAYCRGVTWLWSLFFFANGLVSLALALFGTLEQWTLWCGLLSYVAIGLFFGAEFVVRSWRFRRFGDGLLGRVLSRLMPPRR